MTLNTRSPKRNVALIGAAALSALLAVSGCATTGGGSAKGADGNKDTIRSAFTATPTSFLPSDATAVDDYVVSGLMYEPLVFKDEGNEIVAGLASEWEVTPEQGVFTIRDDMTCADGTKITPTIVRDSLDHFANSNSSFKSIAFGPSNPTITADDAAGTVTIDLAQPWSDLLTALSLPATGIVCPAGLSDPEATARGDVEGAASGAYVLEKKQPGVRYEFKLREDFNGWPEFKEPLEGRVAENMIFSVSNEDSAITNELLTGSLDAAVVRGKDTLRLEESDKMTTERIPAANLFLMFNEREGHPFTDETKRRAVAQALNQDAFNTATNAGMGELATSYAMPSVACYNTDAKKLIAEDTAAAAKELAGVKIRVLGSQSFGQNGAGPTYVAEALRQAGAEVELQNVDNATWAANGRQKPESWDIIVFGNINAGATMWGVMSLFVGTPVEDGGANFTGNADLAMQDRVTAAMAETDDDARCGEYQSMQEDILQSARVVPLSTMASLVATNDEVTMRSPNKTRADYTLRIAE